jgi:hydantoinase/carbamoylase family amidase
MSAPTTYAAPSATEDPCGPRLMLQADELAQFSEDPPRVTRVFLSPQHRAAGEKIASWMREAGMSVRFDAIGNVAGRYEGAAAGAPALVSGSHMDSVRNAGRYDGIFGILCPIECVRRLHAAGTRLAHAIEVVAFADEEGVRFGATLLGSHAFSGTFDPSWLDKKDASGTSMREALRGFGGDPAAIGALKRDPAGVLAFVEVHIEQGPVLLSEGRPLGVVSAIAGGARYAIDVTGLAGHAGTVPMGLRRDALAAAAEMVLAAERVASGIPGTVATVGRIEAKPGAINVIPGDVRFSLDARAGDDRLRERLESALLAEFGAIAARRQVGLACNRVLELRAAQCAPWLMEQLAASLARHGLEDRRLPSGAGHDAMAIAPLADIAMLFVRCGNGGISHHPDETMTAEDATLATDVLHDFILNFRPRQK